MYFQLRLSSLQVSAKIRQLCISSETPRHWQVCRNLFLWLRGGTTDKHHVISSDEIGACPGIYGDAETGALKYWHAALTGAAGFDPPVNR